MSFNKKHNLPHLKEARRNLRKNLTPAEALLWKILKGNKLDERIFHRQHSIENYIVDFYCPSERLIIELDGQTHFTPEGKLDDKVRDEMLIALGYKIIRIENNDLIKNPTGMVYFIRSHFGKM